MDASSDPAVQRVPPYRGTESGLASTFLGAVVFLASPVVAILATQVWAFADRTPNVVLLHAWLARFAVGIPVLLATGGLWMGAAGYRDARRAGQPAPLAVAGLLLSGVGLCGWVLAGIVLLNTTESMLQISK